MHQALYRKWRPKTFSDVCGQEHITSILKYEVAQNKFSHAYLFCGSRGTGKTTCAKILSRAVNCLDPKDGNPCCKCEACLSIENGTATDVLEMDAASNNSVEDIRDIRDEVIYSPSLLKYRVYIIDEVHMLSQSAFNALLKTLEEPPEHVLFLLATTELHKLPATIISRCQRFDFRRISTEVLKDRITYIAKNEGIEIDEKAATLIARQAQGGMRDAISLLELCAGSRKKIDEELVHLSTGSIGRGEMVELCLAVISNDYDKMLGLIANAVRFSKDLSVYWQELLSLYRDLLVFKISSRPREYLDLTDAEYKMLNDIASKLSVQTLSYQCSLVENAFLTMQQKPNMVMRVIAETTLIKMCEAKLGSGIEALTQRVYELEQRVKNLSAAPAVQPEVVKEEVKVKPTQSKKVVDNDDDMFRSDAPPKAIKQVSKPAQNKRVIRPYKNRAEVLDKFSAIDPMNASFISQSKWYIDDSGRIILKFEVPYLVESIKNFGADMQFISVISSVTGVNYTKDTVIFEVDDKKSSSSPIDEIIQNSEE